MLKYQFINHPDNISQNISEHEYIGVDTEFMREKTYFAQLCLVQISTHDDIFCIDPLVENSQTKFWKTLLSKNLVIHSARQDVEVIFQKVDAMPNKIFDTQIAAGLIGMPMQVGYAGLIKELFNIDIAKSYTRADWTRRPLTEAMLDYAAEDVMYLLQAADILSEKLDQKGRLDWAYQDSALLLDPALYDISSETAIDRLKGAKKFRGAKREAAVRLTMWREEEAIHRNRPRQWIIRDNVLLNIAYQLPASERKLCEIEGMSPKLLARFGNKILNIIAASCDCDNDYKPPQPLDEPQRILLKDMQSKVVECAKDLDLTPETIASKRELSSVIASGNQKTRVFNGWRRELIGEKLLQLL
jgi:ribonuclease D